MHAGGRYRYRCSWELCDFSCDSNLVAGSSEGLGAVCVWRAASQQLLRWFDISNNYGPVLSLGFSPCHPSLLAFLDRAPIEDCNIDDSEVFIMGICASPENDRPATSHTS